MMLFKFTHIPFLNATRQFLNKENEFHSAFPDSYHNNPSNLLNNIWFTTRFPAFFFRKGKQMAFKYSPVFNKLDLLLAKLNLSFSNYYFLRKQTKKPFFFPSIADEMCIYLLKINDVHFGVRENAQSSWKMLNTHKCGCFSLDTQQLHKYLWIFSKATLIICLPASFNH